MPEKKLKAIIIGGGPAGLTAAYELTKNTDIQPIIIEKSEQWGGISKTVNYKNNRIDIGGHRFFSKSDVVMEWWQNILPIVSEENELSISYHNTTKHFQVKSDNSALEENNIMLVRKRLSRIFYQKKFFQYPISLSLETILNLGIWNTFLIGLSYSRSVLFPIKKEENLEQFFINRFGKRLYKTFFKDYTEKVWGVKCDEISAEWGAQRIKGLSITKTLIHFFKTKFSLGSKDIKQKDVETSLIEYFLYPKYGPGQMWEVVAEKVESLGAECLLNSVVTDLEMADNKIIAVTVQNIIDNTTQRIEGDYFFSTMPVVELINKIADSQKPKNVIEVANGLVYRDFITVGLLIEKNKLGDLEDNWIYIQEPYVKVGRIQIFNNWSEYLVSDPTKLWIGLEYFCNEGDEIWTLSESDMKELAVKELLEMGMINRSDVIDGVVIKMPKTYPAYFGTYNRFQEIREYTDKFENLFLVGRNGMHKYNNQDHSMLTAIQAVNNIKNNIFEKDNIWNINTEQTYHEKQDE